VSGQSDGITLRSCIFKGYLSASDDSGVTNLRVTNCYFETTPGGYCLSGMNGGGSKVFTGNLYMGKGSGVRQMVPSWGSMRNMIVTNSIFYGVQSPGRRQQY
jgi:hypothetical protein